MSQSLTPAQNPSQHSYFYQTAFVVHLSSFLDERRPWLDRRAAVIDSWSKGSSDLIS